MARRMQSLGSLLFLLMWCPFTMIFAAMFVYEGPITEAALPYLADIHPLLADTNYLDSGAPALVLLFVALTVGMMLFSLVLRIGGGALSGVRNQAVLTSGQLASARIVKAEETGTRINDNPVVRFTLEVYPPDGAAFQAETDKLISVLDAVKYQEGNTVAVRYDPDSQAVAITEEDVVALGGEEF